MLPTNISALRVILSDPQVAAVGLTLQAALGQGADTRAYDVPSSGTAGGAFYGAGTSGTARIVVDERRGVIVGATFTGTDVADWLQAATITMVSETPVELLWQAVPVFPTRSEIWLKLLERREAGLAGAAPQFPRAPGHSTPSPAGPGAGRNHWRPPSADRTTFRPGGTRLRPGGTRMFNPKNPNPLGRRCRRLKPRPHEAQRATFAARCFGQH